VECTITPHIHFSKICKTGLGYSSWSLCKSPNEAKITLLHKELESKIMHEEDEMDTFLASVNKDINEQLISAEVVISDSSLMQTFPDALLDSYQTFAST